MKYWQRWIDRWSAKTAHLSLMEAGAYGALLDHYYAHEQPLENDTAQLMRICGAITTEEQQAVERIVKRFFVKHEDGLLHNKSADEELAKYRAFCALQKARRSGATKGNGLDLQPAWWRYDDGIRDTFAKLGLPVVSGEMLPATKQRCFDEIKRRKDSHE